MPRFRMDAMLNLARTHPSPNRGRILWLAIIETAKMRTRLPFLRFDSGNPNPEECGTRLGARDPRGILGARLPSRIVPEPESASGSCVQDSSAPSSLRFPQGILPRWVRFTTQAQNRSFGRQPFEARCFTAGRAPPTLSVPSRGLHALPRFCRRLRALPYEGSALFRAALPRRVRHLPRFGFSPLQIISCPFGIPGFPKASAPVIEKVPRRVFEPFRAARPDASRGVFGSATPSGRNARNVPFLSLGHTR